MTHRDMTDAETMTQLKLVIGGFVLATACLALGVFLVAG